MKTRIGEKSFSDKAASMDSSAGMSSLQNGIQHKNNVMKGKPVFLFDASVPRNLCLELLKVDKGDSTRH